jgi:hypothetical protein
MEGGVIRYAGTASELRDSPDLLHSAYLLRGSTAPAAVQEAAIAEAEAEIASDDAEPSGQSSASG